MARKYEQEATTSEVEDEPRAWWDQLKKKTFDLRDLATCLPVPTGEAGDPDPKKHKRWDDDSDNSVYMPPIKKKKGKGKGKSKGKGKANDEDVAVDDDDADDQGADEYEEDVEPEPEPKPKSRVNAKAPAKPKAKVERKAPAKRKARAVENVPAKNGDSSGDDQNADDPVDQVFNDYMEGVEQELANEGDISSSVPTEESEGEVEQDPKDKRTAKGDTTSQPKIQANVKATPKKSYSYGLDQDIDDIDEYNFNGYDQGYNGSDDEYIPPTTRGKKGIAKSNGMAQGKATKTVDFPGYGQSTREFEEEIEPQGTRKSGRTTRGTSAAKQNTTTKATKSIAGPMKMPTAQREAIIGSNDATNVTRDMVGTIRTPTVQREAILGSNDAAKFTRDMTGPMRTPATQQEAIFRGNDATEALKSYFGKPQTGVKRISLRENGVVMNPSGTTAKKSENEMGCTEDKQSDDRVVRVKSESESESESESDESKSLFVPQNSDDADKVNTPTDLIGPRDIKQEEVSPEPQNPAAATQDAYAHDFDGDVEHEFSATTGSKRQASTFQPASFDQHPAKRRQRQKKTNDPFGLTLEVDSDQE